MRLVEDDYTGPRATTLGCPSPDVLMALSGDALPEELRQPAQALLITTVPLALTSTFSAWIVSPASRNVSVYDPVASTSPVPVHVPDAVVGPVRFPIVRNCWGCGRAAEAGAASTSPALITNCAIVSVLRLSLNPPRG